MRVNDDMFSSRDPGQADAGKLDRTPRANMRLTGPESESTDLVGDDCLETAQQALCDRSCQHLEEQLQGARLLAAQLEMSRTSHRRIGIATGVLMNAHRLTEPDAFELLRQASMRLNTKLRMVAEHVIDTGCLPEGNPASRALERGPGIGT